MTTLYNDADQTGLSNGTTLTTGNSTGGANTGFSAVTASAYTVSTSSPPLGNACYLAAATTGTQARLTINTTSSSSGAIRCVFTMPASAPTVNIQFLQLLSSSTNYVGITTAGKLFVVLNGSVVFTAASALVSGTTYRVEFAHSIAAGTATVHFAYYASALGTSAVETYDTTTGNTGTTNITSALFGKISTSGNWAAFSIDDLAVGQGQSTLLGPMLVGTGTPATTASVTASAGTGTTSTLAETASVAATGVVGISQGGNLAATASIAATGVVGISRNSDAIAATATIAASATGGTGGPVATTASVSASAVVGLPVTGPVATTDAIAASAGLGVGSSLAVTDAITASASNGAPAPLGVTDAITASAGFGTAGGPGTTGSITAGVTLGYLSGGAIAATATITANAGTGNGGDVGASASITASVTLGLSVDGDVTTTVGIAAAVIVPLSGGGDLAITVDIGADGDATHADILGDVALVLSIIAAASVGALRTSPAAAMRMFVVVHEDRVFAAAAEVRVATA